MGYPSGRSIVRWRKEHGPRIAPLRPRYAEGNAAREDGVLLRNDRRYQSSDIEQEGTSFVHRRSDQADRKVRY